MSTPEFNRESRHKARLATVQALYQMELSGAGSKFVVRDFINHRFTEDAQHNLTPTDANFFEMLVLGVVAHQAEIDSVIAGKLSQNWTLARLDATLRAIVRSAAFETLYCADVPAIVIIDEYVNLTGRFFPGKEAGFVNAAIEKLAKEKRPIEFGVV